MISKIKRTSEFIARQLSEVERPIVACSFGKDSMLMLGLVRRCKSDVPVLYLDAIPHPTKHAFARRIIDEWGLNVVSPRAAYTDVVEAGGHIEIIEIHELAPRRLLIFPIESEPDYAPDVHSVCALERAASSPPPVLSQNFDSVFLGHRGDDVDPTYGAVPLIDEVVDTGDFRYIYPLKDWTERDIWEASALLDIPQNEARYGGDMTANNDYYPLCTECLKRGDNEVLCPKSQEYLPRAGNQLNLVAHAEFWRSQFLNVAQPST